MKSQIAVIDYGMGNLHSVASALEHVAPDTDVIVSSDQQTILAADRVVFPGVGAIRDCMAEIRRLGFDRLMQQEIASGKPVLAICVGLQALMEHSEENDGTNCLSHFTGHVKGFAQDAEFQRSNTSRTLKVPHMGWNQIHQTVDHPIWQDIADNSRFYFVHSYFVQAQQMGQVAGICDYGRSFTAALFQDNVFASQFHPEKSASIGLQLLKNFSQWNGQI